VYLYITVSTPHTYVSFFCESSRFAHPFTFSFSLFAETFIAPPYQTFFEKKTKLRKNLKSNQQEEEKKQLFQFLAAMMFIQVTIHIASCYTIEFIIMIHHL